MEKKEKSPLVVVIIGMAGTGKTSFVASLYRHLIANKYKAYTINLDPAVLHVPYKINIDIRDTVNYKEVMNQHKLGPNGAIMTSLNLFATRFDKVLELLEKRAPKLDFILIDTPGQIEVFNWSASGTIILDTLSSVFPTTVAYIVDTPRCLNPITFISNMLYACSVLYKSKLPFFLCFNKIDVVSHEKCLNWMKDYDSYQHEIENLDTYMASLSLSFALVLNEFYQNIQTVAISSANFEGMKEVEIAMEKNKLEYFREYVPWLNRQKELAEKKRDEEKNQKLQKFKKDITNFDSDDESNEDDLFSSIGKAPKPNYSNIDSKFRNLNI